MLKVLAILFCLHFFLLAETLERLELVVGLHLLSGAHKCLCQVIMCCRRTRLKRNRFFKFLNGLGVFVFVRVKDAQLQMCIGKSAIERSGFLQKRFYLRQVRIRAPFAIP